MQTSCLRRFSSTFVLTLTFVLAVGNMSAQDMRNDAVLGPLLASTFETVDENATMAEAKAAMGATPKCQDIFVTKTGSRSEAILGWITNAIIEENSKA